MPANPHSTTDILIHCPGSHGAIADQVHRQATALHELGLKVIVLCSPNYLRTRPAEYPVLTCMNEGATQEGGLLTRKAAKAKQTIRNQWIFAWQVYNQRPKIVLTGSHTDTQAALWVWPHLILSRFFHVFYATNLHFSARDHTLGPKWWTNLCARLSFTPFRLAVAHKRLSSANQIPRYIHPVEVPLGPDSTPPVRQNPKKIRAGWNVPRGKKVFLSFGTIRNHKNIDLAIRALTDNPDVYLVVIGSVSSHKDRPLKYYQMLADDLGLSHRVYISDEFVGDEKRLSYFQAADFILLTYAGSFHSQSATLTTAVNARRRVLASSGASPMEDLVRHFGLGVYVEADSSDAVANGMATLIHGKLPEPDWKGYEAHATWENNVIRLLQATADHLSGQTPQEHQFEGLEDESCEVPELLHARLLHPPKPTLTRKRATKVKKTTARKQTAATLPKKPLDGGIDEDARRIALATHPVLPGFDWKPATKQKPPVESELKSDKPKPVENLAQVRRKAAPKSSAAKK